MMNNICSHRDQHLPEMAVFPIRRQLKKESNILTGGGEFGDESLAISFHSVVALFFHILPVRCRLYNLAK